MKTGLTLLWLGCLLGITGSIVPAENIHSQGLQRDINLIPSVEKNSFRKNDSLLSVITRKDEIIDMKMDKLEKQLYFLKKENRRMARLLSAKNTEIKLLKHKANQKELEVLCDSSMYIPVDTDTIQKDKTNFIKKLINKLKNNN